MKVPISKQTKLETGAGADQVRVKSTSGTTLVDTQGDSDNIVVANDAQTLVGIVGSLSVVGGSGTADALLVNNQGDLTGAAGSLSGVDVVGLGMSSRITYSVENLTIDLGNAADDFTVTGTHRGTTLINSFGGADQVTLDRVSGVTTVNLGSEDDTVTAVGLEDFETNVFLHGQGGTDQVIWDDTLSTAGRTGILAPSVLSGFAMGGTQSYDGFEDVLLRMSSFNDSVQVTPISFGQVRIDGGSGNDQITAFASHSGNLGDVTLELDGGLSDDRITTNLFGLNHVIINVTNSGGLLAGADTLVVNGSSNGDYFYLDGRGADADITKGLVAMGANSYTEPQRDEVHYRQMDLLIVRSHSGNDNFQVDDNSVETLINLGQGADQVFVANVVTRIDDGVEVVDLDQTSHGVSAKTTIVGGDDNDYFEINHNVAELFLYGDDGDDTFVINTFLVIRDETTNEVKNLTSITGGDGADRYEYLQNALVNIDGGAGNDTVVINGTPIGDVMVVTESLAIAGGRLVYFDNIERLEINASGGDDEIYVLGTKEGVETVVRGGSGEDNIHLGGDHPAFLFDPPQQLISQPVVETTYTETTTVTTVTPSPVLTTVQTFGFASVADGTWINSISLPPTAIFLTAQIVNVHSSFVNFQLIITYDIAIFYKFPDLVTTEDVTHTYTETIAPQAQLFDANPYFFKEDAVHDLRAIQGKLTIDAGTTLGDNDRIFVHNTNGTDSDGALVTTTVPDREATLVQKKYENGDPLFEIVQSTDAFGNPLFDANGKPITEQIPVYEQVQFPVLDENGDPVTTLVQVFEEDHVTPVLDAAGNFVYEEVQVYTSGFQNVLDESGNVVTREYLNLQGFGLGSGEQIDQSPYSGVELVGLEEVVLYLSDQAEHLTLENTFDGQTTVVLGDGDDTVDVQQIDGPTRILGGAGSDTVNVANDQQTVDQIAANLTFEGDKHLAEVLVPIPPTDPILNESDALFVDNGVAMIEVADIDQDGRIKTIQVQATDTDDLDSDGNTSEFLYITASGELVTTDTGIPFIVPEVVMRSVPLNYANGTVSLTTLTPGDDVTNEVQSLVRFGVPAGTFQLERLGNRTSSLAYNATAQQLQDALNQLPDMPVVAVTGSGVSGDPWVITYSVPGDQPPLIARDGELRKVVESDHPTDGNGTAYADHLFLDSSGSTTDLTGTLTNTQLFGLQSNGTITYSQLETMTVSLGSGHDTFNVQGTKASTQLNTGAGDDRILVASDANADLTDGVTSHGHVDHITSPLSIDAQSGDNQLMISDFDSNSPDLNVGITDHSVTGLAPADISYQATAAGTFSDGMVVWTGSNNDTVRISSLELSGETITSVYAGEGDDTIQSTVADNLVSPAHANLPLNTDRRLRIITAQGADVVDLGSAQLATHVETGTGRDVIKGGSGDDLLWAGLGSDVVFGGPGHDIIRPDDAQADAAGSGNDIVFGDNGSVTYVANGNDVTLASYDPNGSLDPYRPATDHVLKTAAATTGPAVGGNDDILSLWGEDIIVAGAGQDTIDARSNADRNIIFGDHGQVNFDTNGNLISAASTDVTIGDSDTILAGEGDDVLFGGSQADRIEVHAVASRTVAFGDHGQATFDAQGNWLQVQSLFETAGGNDLLLAVDGHDVLLGGFGSDTISGGAGDNLIIGDDGQIDYLDNWPQYAQTIHNESGAADTITSSAGADVILGGLGGDDIDAGTGDVRDTVLGDHGRLELDADRLVVQIDSIELPVGSAAFDVGGDDIIAVHDGSDVVLGGFGADWINFDTNGNPIGADEGNDVILGDDGSASFSRTSGSHQLIQIASSPTTQAGNDHINAAGGADVVIGGGGSDTIDAGLGNHIDILLGDYGTATFTNEGVVQTVSSPTDANDAAAGGDDFLLAGDGNDVVMGGVGTDYINVDPVSLENVGTDGGNDVMVGDNGVAEFDVDANTGLAVLRRIQSQGSTGAGDYIFAGDGFDVVIGGAGADVIDAGEDASPDVLLGDNGLAEFNVSGALEMASSADETVGGSDTILSGAGDDLVFGGANDDLINASGVTGNNILLGDHGQATFQLGTLISIESKFDASGGSDTILTGGGNDVVIGGANNDYVNVDADSFESLGTDGGKDIQLGDNGYAEFDASGQLVRIETRSPGVGGNDYLFAGSGADVQMGGGGDDDVRAGEDDDIVLGDHGQAEFVTGSLATLTSTNPEAGGNDVLDGGAGADKMIGGSGADTIRGGAGTDILLGDQGLLNFQVDTNLTTLDFVSTDPSKDTDPQQLTGGNDVLDGGADADTMLGAAGQDQVDAGSDGGHDIVLGDHGELTFVDGRRQRIASIYPTEGAADDIETLGGSDTVLGGFGADTILTGDDTDSTDSADLVLGDNGELLFDANDALSIARTTDAIQGGNDTIDSGLGADTIVGGTGDDSIQTGQGNDLVLGDQGEIEFVDGAVSFASTTVPESAGLDLIDVGLDDDLVFGGSGADTIRGGQGNDLLFGDNGFVNYLAYDTDTGTLDVVSSAHPTFGGPDQIDGDDGIDYIFGGTDSDLIHGGNDHDVILGDHGKWDADLPIDQPYQSIFISDEFAATGDQLHGDAGDDVILGQQGTDTISGGAGEDDLIGGHNVASGSDAGDQIQGGDEADVILGDNGQITRELKKNQTQAWYEYPTPFNDVIRQIQRFDHIDLIGGADHIDGDAGDDIIYGQRGNDSITGGTGSDELVGGLGVDQIQGGADSDFILGDEGTILRDFDRQGNPRLNDNGVWHRDVFLEEVGTITGIIDMDQTPLRQLDPQLAAKLMQADLVVLGGAVTANGDKVSSNDNGAWDTELLLISLHPAEDDDLAGDEGDDILFGQRGNDVLSGGANNDLLLGDWGINLSSQQTDLPHMGNGLRLLATDASVTSRYHIDVGGSVIMPAINLFPEEWDLNDPFQLNAIMTSVASADAANFQDVMNIGPIGRTDGTGLQAFVSIVPQIVGHEDALPGNDHLFGNDGNDMIVADRAVVRSPLVTGLTRLDEAYHAAQDALDRTSHMFGLLANDFDYLQHLTNQANQPHDVVVGSDVIDAGAGDDQVIGDEGVVIPSFVVGLPVPDSQLAEAATTLFQYFKDVEHLATDADFVAFEAHYHVLNSLAATAQSQGVNPHVAPNHHRLLIGNDTLTGSNGNDLLIADYGVLVNAVVTGDRFNAVQVDTGVSAAAWSAAETALDSALAARNSSLAGHIASQHNRANRLLSASVIAQAPWDFEHPLEIGNDVVTGDQNADLIVGDFGVFASWVTLSVPATSAERSELESQIETLSENVSEFLEARSHITEYSRLIAGLEHAYFGERGDAAAEVAIVSGSDTLLGGDGNDLVMADSISVAAGYQSRNPDVPFESKNAAFKVRFLNRQNFELTNHYSRAAGVSRIANDSVEGGLADDWLYGQEGNDVLHGQAGVDVVYGGIGSNSVDGGGQAADDARSVGDNEPESTGLTNLEQAWFASLNDWQANLAQQAAGDPTVDKAKPQFLSDVGHFVSFEHQGLQISGDALVIDIIGQTGGSFWVAKSTGTSFANVNVGNQAGSQTWTTVRQGDFNGDGKSDIVGRSSDGKWWLGTSNGSSFDYQIWGQWSTAVTWSDVLVADVDGDGLDDLIGRTQLGAWWTARSTGTSFENKAWGSWSTAVTWSHVKVADVDGDGKDDVVGRIPSGQWWVGRSNGTKFNNELWGNWSNTIGWVDVNIADVNGDGLADIVGRTSSGQWWVAKSTGSGFANQRFGQWSPNVTWLDVQIADVDGDGNDDVLGRASSGGWWVAKSNGSQFQNQLWATWNSAIAWTSVQVGDFNGDGRSDVAGRATDGSWWVGVSDGQRFTTTFWGRWSTAVGWSNIMVGDFK